MVCSGRIPRLPGLIAAFLLLPGGIPMMLAMFGGSRAWPGRFGLFAAPKRKWQ
jgi:hypothetical protein